MRIALVGRAYTGKSSIARELGTRNFVTLGFSDYLKSLAVGALNSTGQTVVTLRMVLEDKSKYRRFIQEFGSLIGFDSNPAWLRNYLSFVSDAYKNFDIVIDCLRSVTQAEVAREFGFKIVGVAAALPDRTAFAGGGDNGFFRVYEADEHPIDGQLDLSDYTLDYCVVNGGHVSIPAAVGSLLEFLSVPAEALNG